MYEVCHSNPNVLFSKADVTGIKLRILCLWISLV